MIAGHLQEKSGYYYAVLNYKDQDGKRHTPWVATNLPVKGNKRRAEEFLQTLRKTYVPPITDEEALREADLEKLLFSDFLVDWLKVAKSTIKLTTYASYACLMESAILPHFNNTRVKLRTLTAKHIQDFYTCQLERVSPNTVIHFHAIIHRALKYAVKMEMINSNPADRVERPKKEQFVGQFYDANEMNQLFRVLEGSVLQVPIMLGAFYGLRRSEILGLKWSAIDFEDNTISICHTVAQIKLDGKKMIVESDTPKTKSSRRTLPLVPAMRSLLIRQREQQEHYQRICGKAYSKDYQDYVCLNQLGERLKPDYLTAAFKKILISNNLRVIRLHDLRHSCASLLLANGVPMKQIQEWLGHSQFSTTADIYAHLDYKSKHNSATALIAGLGLDEY